MHCFWANMWYRTENPRAVWVFVSPVLTPSSTNCRVDSFATLDFQTSPSSDLYGAGPLAIDFVARGRLLRGLKRLAPLAKRSTCSKSNWRTGYTYCSVRGIKVSCMLGGGKSSLVQDVLWKYRTVFFTTELYFLIPTTRSRHSRSGSRKFICKKKARIVFLSQKHLRSTKKIYQRPGLALGAVFIKKVRSKPNFPLRPKGNSVLTNLWHNSKIALIITPKLLACCKKALFLASPEKHFSNKRNKKWASH